MDAAIRIAPVQVGTLACGSGSFAAKVFLELGLRVAHVQLTRLLASCCAPRVRVDCLVLPERQLVGED
jgi:hypothetical protein